MISDQAIAENINRLISKRQETDTHISIESAVYDGVRYITLTAMDNKKFLDSYGVVNMWSEILGFNRSKESFENSYFVDDWEAIEVYVIDQIKRDESLPVCISGYGVAGAVAVIGAHSLIRKQKYIVDKVVTFGAPHALNLRNVNGAFIRMLGDITTQYVFPGDPMVNAFRWSRYSHLSLKELKLFKRDRKNLSMESYATSSGVSNK